MPVSDEELQKLRDENEALRGDIAEAESAVAQTDAEKQREYDAAQLLIENTRLKAQLASAEAKAEHAESGDGAVGLAEASQTQLEAAQAALENPQGVPVDTNSGVTEPEGETEAPPENVEVPTTTAATPTATTTKPAEPKVPTVTPTDKNGGNS